MSTIIRSTVMGSKPEKKLRELQTLFEIDSAQSDMEHLEPYGFTSEPFVDGATDALNLYFDDECNHGVVLNVADRPYRITDMKEGEVAIYDDKGRKVYLKRDCIEVDGVNDPINVKTGAQVNITAPTVNITGNVNITGKVTTSSTISAAGDVSAGGISLQGHTHGGVEPGGGSTGTPQ